ncbi:MAG: hypothetical protein GXP39_07585 [Chloroflexi bacterium]|nr:hypothetical protein [Chloroflexota bacterium]
MSGICAIVNLDGSPVDPKTLRRMAEAAAHRGPDGIRYWIHGHVGLAHLALHSTPELPREHQTRSNGTRTCWITADARIYNRKELLRSLLGSYVRPEPTDADLILAAYERWGIDFPRHLLGDFAFALWDQQRQTLVLGRDHLGIRPLVYYQAPQVLVCASEIKQLLQHPDVPNELNEAALGDFLISGCVSHPEETTYRGIQRLPPAHVLIIRSTSTQHRRYWSLDDVQPIRYEKEESYAEHFRDLLTEAVLRRTRGKSPFGIMMSGGLDSTSIASLAVGDPPGSHGDPGRVEAFSFVFDEIPECDERENIEAIARQYGLRTTYIPADHCWPLGDYPRTLLEFDEPTPAIQYLLWDTALDIVRSRGHRFVLTGYGGDDVCAESPLAYFHHLQLLRPIRFGVDIWHYWRRYQRLPPLRLRAGIFRLLPVPMRRRIRPNAWDLPPVWLDPKFERKHGLAKRQKEGLGLHRVKAARAQSLIWITGPGLQSWLSFIDQMMSLHSLEARHPFLDKQLVEFAFAIPLEQFLTPTGEKKPLLRQAMQGRLPDQIRTARAKVLADPLVSRGLRERGVETIHQLLRSPELARRGYVNGEKLREQYERFRRGEMADSWVIWYALIAEIWLNRLNHRGRLQVDPGADSTNHSPSVRRK